MPQAGLEVLKKRDDVDYEILGDDDVAVAIPSSRTPTPSRWAARHFARPSSTSRPP